MQAFTLTRPYVPFGDVYPQIRDAEIIACNGAAAEILGYQSPDAVVGKMLGDTQTTDDRYLGRAAYVLRNLGIEVVKVYCTTIQRPDGETVTVRKEVLGTQMRSNGLDVMLTRMELVKEATDDLPDPAQFDVSEEQIRKKIGWTIREASCGRVRNILKIPDSLSMILSEHGDLLSSVNGPLFSWSRRTNNVKRRISCPGCGWLYWSGLKVKHPQCSQCGWMIGKGWGKNTGGKRRPYK